MKEKTYKTFDDLIFKRVYPKGYFGNLEFFTAKEKKFPAIRAKLKFDNGYGVSVIQGWQAYTDNHTEYELAVLKNGSLCYDTYITDDVLGHLSQEKVTEVMKQVQDL